VAESEPTPPLTESARSVYDAARVVAGAWSGSFVALRRLVVADLALARVALVRGLVLLFLAAIMFGTMWVLLTALAVWLLLKAGLGWGMALAVPLLVSAIVGVLAMLSAAKSLRLADLDASRRQLTLLFGTREEAQEAMVAPPGTLHAGAAPESGEQHDPKTDQKTDATP
jgi:MFS family permease